MISANSRYANSAVITAQRTKPGFSAGSILKTDIRVIVFSQPQDFTIQYTFYQITGADTVDLLAYRYYSDPTLWWQIANANPEITNWSQLVVGSLIRIPLINGLR